MEKYDLDELLLQRESDMSRWMASVSNQGADGQQGEPASTLLNTVLGRLSTRVFVFDCDMTLVWVNDYGARQFGFTPEEMIGKNWYRLIPRMEAHRPIYEKVMQGETQDCLDATVDFPEGSRYFNPHYSPIWSADGAVIGMVAVVDEVTERRRSEQEKLVVDEIARIISSTLDLEEVYEKFAQEVQKVVDFDRMNINLIDLAAGVYVVKYIFGLTQAGRRPGDVVALKGSQTEEVITSGRPAITRDATTPIYPADSLLAGIGLRSRIILPLKHRGQNIGAMSLHSTRPSAFGAREQALLERLAGHIAPAIAHAELYDQARREMATVDEVARIITSTLEVSEVYQKFSSAVRKLLNFDRMHFNTINEATGLYTRSYVAGPYLEGHNSGGVQSLAGTQTNQVLLTGQTIIRSNIGKDALHFPGDKDHLQAGLRASAAVPLYSRGRVFGVMVLRCEQAGAYGPREQAILERLASQIAPALENAQLYEQAKREMAVADEVARIVTSTLDIEQVYDKFAGQVKHLVPFDRINIHLVDQESGTFTNKYEAGLTNYGSRPAGDFKYPLGNQVEFVVQTRRTLVRSDLAADPTQFHFDRKHLAAGLRSSIAIPLLSGGQAIGVLALRSRQVGAYGIREQALLERLAAQISPAVENARKYGQVLVEKERTATALAHLASVLAGVDSAIILTDAQGRILWANQRCSEFFGIREIGPADMGSGSSQTVQRMLAGCSEDAEESVAYAQQVYDGKTGISSKTREVEIGHPQEARTLEEFTAPVYDEQGGSIGRLWVYHDISERKKSADALRESEARNQAFLNAIPDLMFRMSRDGTYLDFKGDEGYAYVSYKEFIGKNIKRVVPPELAQRTIECIESALLSQEVQTLQYQLLVAGELRDYEARIVAIGEDEALAIARDFTQQKKTEEEMREREELARQNSRLASIGQLASGVAHEINNPLGIIQGFAELVLREGLPPRASEDIQVILDQTQRAARIVKNLLSLASPQIRKKELVGVRNFITRATEMKANELQLCNIHLTTWFSSEIPSVFGDFYQMVEVMLNVITNAQHAMYEAHGGGELKISAQGSGDSVMISISDNGPGISHEHLTRIFDPFFTTKKIGKGTGLGLSISHGIIADHSGEIWAESQEGVGTTFHVALPAAALPTSSLPASSGVEGAVTSGPVWAGAPAPAKRVLVVDDDPGYRELIGKALAAQQCHVDQAENGQEAWDMAQMQTYDCIIIDLMMPVLTGQQLYQRVKGSNSELAERCIFITGATFGQDVEEFLASVENPSLSKPFSLDEIGRHVSGMWDSDKTQP